MLVTSSLPAAPTPAALLLAPLLASPEFARCPRLRLLLRFLLERQQAGALRDLNEYTIGIEVFGRSSASYQPGDDPIVRVQVGRLRTRLHRYYSGSGRHANVLIVIPRGSYVPQLQPRPTPPARRFGLTPLRCLGGAAGFVHGLNEELACQLLRQFGVAPAQAAYLLEGSVRADAALLRVTLHLRAGDALVWSERFDCAPDGSIAAQAALATAIGAALAAYFSAPAARSG